MKAAGSCSVHVLFLLCRTTEQFAVLSFSQRALVLTTCRGRLHCSQSECASWPGGQLECDRRGRLQPALEARAVGRMRAVGAGERADRAVRAAAAQRAGVAEEAEPAEGSE